MKNTLRRDGMKRIRLTIEWDGACSEKDWARQVARQIKRMDADALTRVVMVELLTDVGQTRVRDLRELTLREHARIWWRRWLYEETA